MASVKISDLPAAVSVAGTDVVPVVQSGATKKAAASLLVTGLATSGANSDITALSGITGTITSAQGTIAANTPALVITQTWNNVGVSFVPLTITATDTNSTGVGTGFIDCKIGSASKFSANKAGIVSAIQINAAATPAMGGAAGANLVSDRLYVGSGGTLNVGSSALTNTVAFDGVINKVNTAFGLKVYTVATLPSTAGAGKVTGAEAAVSDGDSGLAWGATVANTGSGATPYKVWYNGTNWTVVGK